MCFEIYYFGVMHNQMLLRTTLLLGCLFLCGSFLITPTRTVSGKASTFTITIKITNVRNTKGRIQLQLYRDQESFKKEVPWKSTYISKKGMSGHTIIHKISGFKPGVYGLALLDDENSNTEMDYGWVMPKEGFGFSDYYHTEWSKPKFNDFKFHLKANKTVTMRVRYM